MSAGLLFSQMESPPGREDEFHRWYEHDHIPARMRIGGFEGAVRYRALDGAPRFLACYFLDQMAALSSPEYVELKRSPGALTEDMLGSVTNFTRYICDLISDTGEAGEEAGALQVVAFPVAAADVAEFDAWYEEEHVPMLIEAPGWLRVRRYLVRDGFDGPRWTHLALHELRDAETMNAPQRAAARRTTRREALTRHRWFGEGGRWLYEPIHVAHLENPATERGA